MIFSDSYNESKQKRNVNSRDSKRRNIKRQRDKRLPIEKPKWLHKLEHKLSIKISLPRGKQLKTNWSVNKRSNEKRQREKLLKKLFLSKTKETQNNKLTKLKCDGKKWNEKTLRGSIF